MLQVSLPFFIVFPQMLASEVSASPFLIQSLRLKAQAKGDTRVGTGNHRPLGNRV